MLPIQRICKAAYNKTHIPFYQLYYNWFTENALFLSNWCFRSNIWPQLTKICVGLPYILIDSFIYVKTKVKHHYPISKPHLLAINVRNLFVETDNCFSILEENILNREVPSVMSGKLWFKQCVSLCFVSVDILTWKGTTLVAHHPAGFWCLYTLPTLFWIQK